MKIDYRHEIEKLDAVIAPYLHPDFFFLNIGACDGVMGDPVYPLVRRHHWRGIAVEPVPYNFERLQRNYADEPQVILENAAISTEPQTFWYVDEGSKSLPHIVSQVGSLNREHVLRNLGRLKIMAAGRPLPRQPHHLEEFPPVDLDEYDEDLSIDPDIEEYLTGIDIPCLTFNELLSKHQVASVDYLNIDAEGADYEIFKMIDFDVVRPRVICMETTSFDDDVSASLLEDLDEQGYEFAIRYGLFSKVYVRRD
ncbi:MAG: FkbM family methyltransferase [Acidimicrobiales bacterium]